VGCAVPRSEQADDTGTERASGKDTADAPRDDVESLETLHAAVEVEAETGGALGPLEESESIGVRR
jgi:hypothetical protein